MLAVRTPGAPQATRTVAQPAIPPSPLRDRVGYSDHVRFRGYFPVHFIPAYNLPVYASQWPLSDTTQDSVRGCSLGFTAAAIRDSHPADEASSRTHDRDRLGRNPLLPEDTATSLVKGDRDGRAPSPRPHAP